MSVYKKLLTSKQIIALGEAHNSKDSIDSIYAELDKFNPKWILHELLYADVVLNKKEIASRLRNSKSGGICDPDLNEDIYQYGYDNNIKLVGIDKAIVNKEWPLHRKMTVREDVMVSTIQEWLDKINSDKVAIIVGDTHIRNGSFDDLPESSLTIYLKSIGATIIRADESIREVD